MILIISSVFPPEPVVSASIAYDLSSELGKTKKVVVISPRPTRPLDYSFEISKPLDKNFEHIILESYTYPKSRIFGRLRESYSFGRHAANFIKRNYSQIQCIFIHAWPLLAPLLIIKASIKLSIPVVSHVVDIYPEALIQKLPFFNNFIYKLLLPMDEFVLKNSSKIVTISPKMKRHLVKTRKLEESRVEVIYNWQNEEWFLKYKTNGNKSKTSDRFTFMYLGNLSRTASLDSVIYAFDKCSILNSRLIIAGNGSEKETLLNIVKKCNNTDIIFMDAPMELVPEIQDQADVLLLSLKKGASMFALPSKLSAYMFSEKPIIACVEQESDTAKVIKEANCGWIVAPQNIELLSAVMREAASLPTADIHIMGKNATDYSWKKFTKRVNLNNLVNVVNQLIKN